MNKYLKNFNMYFQARDSDQSLCSGAQISAFWRLCRSSQGQPGVRTALLDLVEKTKPSQTFTMLSKAWDKWGQEKGRLLLSPVEPNLARELLSSCIYFSQQSWAGHCHPLYRTWGPVTGSREIEIYVCSLLLAAMILGLWAGIWIWPYSVLAMGYLQPMT